MKKVLRVVFIVVVLLLATLFVLPFAFQGKLKQMALDQANAQLNAKVNFDKVSLSLFRSFPDFSFRIQGVTVDGQDAFSDVRLLEMGSLDLTLDLMSVINGDQIELERFAIANTTVRVFVNDSGKANYDIVKAAPSSADTAAVTEGEAQAFALQLKQYAIDNFDLHYIDQSTGTELHILELRHSGKGDFTQDVVDLRTETRVDALSARSSGIDYLRNASVSTDFDLRLDQKSGRVTFGENNLYLNALGLYFEGWVEAGEDAVDMDMRFSSPGADFKEVLSLIPTIFMKDFETVSTNGRFALSGMVKGRYAADADALPAFGLDLEVANGSFKYPDLPAGVDNILVDLELNKAQGDLDELIVDLKEASATIAENPFFLRFLLKTPLSDPAFDLAAKGRLDLASLADIAPIEGTDYSGRIDADFKVAGKQSDIDQERFDAIGAKGVIAVEKLHLNSDSLAYPIDVDRAQLELQPQRASLKAFKARMGKSDVQLEGNVENITGYVLSDGTLKADFRLNSGLLDLNELSGGSGAPAEEETTNDSAATMEVVRVPTNIDFTLDSRIDQLLFGKLDIRAMEGELRVAEGAVRLNKVGMEMLGGTIAADGGYNSLPEVPEVDMNFNLKEVGFRESYEALALVRQLAPVMEKTSGTYSTRFNFKADLKTDMSPDLQSVDAAGRLQTSKLKSEPEVMKKVADVLKDPSLKSLSLNPIDLEFEIADGRMRVKPFDFQTAGIKGKVSGSTGLDQSIDYTMDMNVPTDRIGSSELLGSSGLQLPAKVDVKVFIEGKTTSPTVRTSLGDLAGSLADDLKDQATQIVEEKVEEVKEDANKKAQELIDQAEAQGDALIEEARKQGDALRAEAKKQADAVRAEAEKNAAKLEKEAKGNFLKEAAAKEAARKLRQEGEKQANKIEAEADKQARQLVEKAEAEKASLVEKARKEAVIN